MLKNFFVVAVRNLFKSRLYSVINITGLSIGIVCSVLILLWVHDETSFDSFLPKAGRLYQVWVNAEFDGSITSWSSVPLPTYEEMKTADGNILNSVVTGWGSQHLLTVDDTITHEDGQYTVRYVGANHNLVDVNNENQVSLVASLSAGLIQIPTSGLTPTEATQLDELHRLRALQASKPVSANKDTGVITSGDIEIVTTDDGTVVTGTRS